MDSSNKRSRSHQENITIASAYKKFRSRQENKTLASSSSSPSSLPLNGKHHLFVSFHGADVRVDFLSHILELFRSKGISAFIDNDMERGMSIGPVLIGAIRESRVVLVLLSERYASSRWCLNELAEIIKCRDESGHKVVPVFYKVDPTDVKKQTGDFGKVFGETCKGKTKEDIERWEHALKEVAQITGYHSRNWNNEAEMINKMATDVSNKLNNSSPSSDFEGLVGMESHMTSMEPLLQLDSKEVRRIGIWGPPGIGKTAISRYIFNRYSGDFPLRLFMDNIKTNYAKPARSDDYSVKLYYQEQFLSQLFKEKGLKVPHLGIVKDRLKDKKVLVVLDDVNQSAQLEAMAKETGWFGPGSLIIITTQDQMILEASDIDHYDIYKVDLPSHDEALEMFCMYAFGQKYPDDSGFWGLAWEVTEVVGRLPLGLRIIGSYFRGLSKSKQEWTKALRNLWIHLNGDIESILMFSYDALSAEDKKLFLHIACFFKKESVDTVEGCLEDSISGVALGIGVLVKKSLIDIDIDCEEIEMHDLLVQLGREIVQKQEPGKRRKFLVDAKDIEEVLSDDKADTSSVIGIDLRFSYDNKKDITCTSERVFERFSNLRFLRVDGIWPNSPNPRSLNYISQKLRFLSWQEFGMPCLPSSFHPNFLVKLDMSYSELEKLWDDIKPLSNLKEIYLCFSVSLRELPDLSTATNLRKLDLSYCPSLVELPSSMKNLCRLSELELMGCKNLEVNLANINLESLRELDLSNCSLLKSYPESCTSIEDFHKLSGDAIKETPWEMSNCEIQELGLWFGRRSRLRRLVLRGMKKMVSLPQLPYSVVELDADKCESLERLDCSFRNPDIRYLNFAECFKLNQEARDLIIQTPTNGYAVLPGGEVPVCFPYRSSGSSVTVKLNQMPLVGTSTKFKACIILADEADEDKVVQWRKGSVYCNKSKQFGGFCKNIGSNFEKHLYIFEVEAVEVTSTELAFEFRFRRKYGPREIKECGVLQLLEVPSC